MARSLKKDDKGSIQKVEENSRKEVSMMRNLLPIRRMGDRGFLDFYKTMDDFFLSAGTIKLDVQEKDEEYIVEAEVPGYKKEEISVDLSDETLTISAKREERKEEEKKNYVHKERKYESASRSIYLPGAIEEGIKAKLSDGMLSINVPKNKKEKSRSKIEIE